MRGVRGQLAVFVGIATLAAAGWTLAGRARPDAAEAGLWFDDVSFLFLASGATARAPEEMNRGGEQYFGDMRWAIARPWLDARLRGDGPR